MNQVEDLKLEAKRLKAENPRLRNRDLAQKIGISEAELLSLYIGENVVRLDNNCIALLKEVHKMGYVMALTRNENCVHERKGVYENLEFYGGAHNMGVAVNPDIDLRFFMNEWQYALAVTMPRGEHGTLYSFQFFNAKGEAVHKIFSTPKSEIAAYHEIVENFTAENQEPITDADKSPYDKKQPKPDSEIDIAAFQNAWKSLKDTHDFFGMLRKYGVRRTQGFRLAPAGYTQKIDNDAVIRMLNMAAERQVSIMCFLHSKGCVQIHTGEVRNLKQMDTWYNVLDPKFNLHLKLDTIEETWIVRKPTVDGVVTSLELFDQSGDLIVYFFGARKPGIPELETWRTIINDIQQVPV